LSRRLTKSRLAGKQVDGVSPLGGRGFCNQNSSGNARSGVRAIHAGQTPASDRRCSQRSIQYGRNHRSGRSFSPARTGERHADDNSPKLRIHGVCMLGASSDGDGSCRGASVGLYPFGFPTGICKAPSMQARALAKTTDGSRPWVLVFGKGDEVMSGLANWAKRENIKAGHFAAIGCIVFGAVRMVR
jgi:hypothetical protein